VVAVPVNGRFKPWTKVYFWFPAEFAKQARVDRVAEVMPDSVFDVHDCGLVSIAQFNERLCQLKIRNLVSSADVVYLSDVPGTENTFDCVAVVINVNPISNIAAIAI
jgi:hypothetical protein